MPRSVGAFCAAFLLAMSIHAQGGPKTTPVFPASSAGLVYIEGEDALSTNFAREPTLDYSSSGLRILQLNREPQAAGVPFFAEFSVYVEEEGSWSLWIGGTPPGPRSELTPSYASPFAVRIDGGEPRALYREDVAVVETYSLNNYWFVAEKPFELSKGAHSLRIEVSEKRRYDTRYFFSIDALFLLESASPIRAAAPVQAAAPDRSALPARFPRDLSDRSIDNPYSSIAEYETRIQAEPMEKKWYLQLALVYGILGDHGNAIKILSRGRLVAGDDPRFSLMAAKNRIWSGEADEGLRLYREYLAGGGGDSAVWAEAAKVSAWLAKYADSLALYRDALARYPEDLNLQVNNGLTFLWAGKVAEGETALVAAEKKAFGDAAGVKTLASIFKVNGYPDKQRATLDKGIERFRDELELYLLAMKAAHEGDDAAQAAKIEARVRERFAPSAELDLALESLRLGATRKKEALDRYAERLAAAPDDLELRRELVRAYYWNGRLNDAVAEGGNIIVNKLYRLVLELERDLAETWRLLDFLAVSRARTAAQERLAKETASGLRKAHDEWKKAEGEARKLPAAADQARKDRVASDLSAAEDRLATSLASAGPLRISVERSLAEVASLIGAAGTEASAEAADAAILATLGKWSWMREADLAQLSALAARGDELPSAILDRIDLIERKPDLAASREAPRAMADGSAAAEPLEARKRALVQARLWLTGKGAGEELSAPWYFGHGPSLAAFIPASIAASGTVPGTDAPDGGAEASGAERPLFSEFAPASALETAAALEKSAASVPASLAKIRDAASALHRRASARLRVRMYQHDTESTDERRELAEAYLRLDLPRDARDQLARVLLVVPGDVHAAFTLGRAQEIAGDWSGAMDSYRKVYSIDPRFENIAGSYNRLARSHASRFNSAAAAFVDGSRTTTTARMEYAAGGTSLMGFSASYAIDDIRVHSAIPPSIPAAVDLHSVDLSLNLSLPRLDLTVSAVAGGTAKNKLWSESSSWDEAIEISDVPGFLVVAPKLGGLLDWRKGPFALNAAYSFDQLKDSFLPGRDSWYEQAGEATFSTYFAFPSPSILQSAGTRFYGRLARVSAPFAEGTNLLRTALAELSFGFLLSSSPWTTLTLGANAILEDSAEPGSSDYYAPDAVLSGKGGFQVSTWIGAGKGWVAGLSGRLWGGLWSDASAQWPTLESSVRAELSKGDLVLYVETAFSRTGDAATVSYWSAQMRLGATIAVPSYIIP